jgi:hypothetical protein
LCGQPVAELDALWITYKTYKYSLIESFLYPVDARTMADSCPGTLALSGGGGGNVTGSFVSFTHQYVSENSEDRKKQKFKLIQVRVCQQGVAA